MYSKIEKLCYLNEKMDALVREAKKCNKELQEEYKKKEEVAVGKFLNSLENLASYGKRISYSNGCKGIYINTEIPLNFYKGSYGDTPKLLVEINESGIFKLKTNPTGYSSRPTIYNSQTNKWGWYQDECSKFFALYGNRILDVVQREIEKQLQKSMTEKMETELSKQQQLLILIDMVQKNM